jgi:hypothetical protein
MISNSNIDLRQIEVNLGPGMTSESMNNFGSVTQVKFVKCIILINALYNYVPCFSLEGIKSGEKQWYCFPRGGGAGCYHDH